jgi:tetratricopeptide (TPR) repeat protein
VLRCATEALAPDHPKLNPSVLSLYLKGCADLSSTPDTRLAIPAFKTVTEKAPRFAGGWGKLLVAELEAFKATSVTDRNLQEAIRRHVAQASRVDPNLAEIFLVQSWLQPPRPILGWMRFAEQALQRKPDNAAILENHATGLGHVGLIGEAVEDARRASEIEPLSPGIRQTLISFLGDSGAYEAARRELGEAERLWPGASSILQARYFFEYNHGDPNKALAIIESGRLGFPISPAHKSFLQARRDKSPSTIARAIGDAREAFEREGGPYRLIQTLAAFGQNDEVIEVLLKADPKRSPGIISTFFRRPSMKEVRRDPRFMEVARRYGLVDYWTATGRWPDYCFEPDLPYDCEAEAKKLAS